jgi:hypothetical protein
MTDAGWPGTAHDRSMFTLDRVGCMIGTSGRLGGFETVESSEPGRRGGILPLAGRLGSARCRG